MKVFIIGSTMLLSILPNILASPMPLDNGRSLNTIPGPDFQCSIDACDICPGFPGCADLIKHDTKFTHPCPPICDGHGYCGCANEKRSEPEVAERSAEPEAQVTDSPTTNSTVATHEDWNIRPCPGGLICDQHHCICKRDIADTVLTDDASSPSDLTVYPREAWNIHPCPGSLKCNKHACHCDKKKTRATDASPTTDLTTTNSTHEDFSPRPCPGGWICNQSECVCKRDGVSISTEELEKRTPSALNIRPCPGGLTCNNHGHCRCSKVKRDSGADLDTHEDFSPRPCPGGWICNQSECVCKRDGLSVEEKGKRADVDDEDFPRPCTGGWVCNQDGCLCRRSLEVGEGSAGKE